MQSDIQQMQNRTDKLYEALVDSIKHNTWLDKQELNLLWATLPHKEGYILTEDFIADDSADLLIYDSEQYDIESITKRLKADDYKLRYYDHRVLGRLPTNISLEK